MEARDDNPKEVVVWEGVVDGHHLVFSNINGELWEECVTIEHPHVLSLIAKRGLPIALLALHARAVAAEEKLARAEATSKWLKDTHTRRYHYSARLEAILFNCSREAYQKAQDWQGEMDAKGVERRDSYDALESIAALCATFPVSAIDPAKLIEDIKKACDGVLGDKE